MFEGFVPPPEPEVYVVPKRNRKSDIAAELPPEEPVLLEASPLPDSTLVSVKQPTGHLTQKMTAVGLSGGFMGALVAWLKYRVGIDITAIDVALFGPLVMVAAGWFMREKAPAWMQTDEFRDWLGQ